MNVHSARLLTNAIVFALESANLNVGDAERPETVPANEGYVVVYGLTGGVTDGPVGLPDDDAEVIYQLTSVGHDRQQAEGVADKARRTLLASTLPLAGDRKVTRVSIDMLGGIVRDDDVQPSVFFSADRYRIYTTPLVNA